MAIIYSVLQELREKVVAEEAAKKQQAAPVQNTAPSNNDATKQAEDLRKAQELKKQQEAKAASEKAAAEAKAASDKVAKDAAEALRKQQEAKAAADAKAASEKAAAEAKAASDKIAKDAAETLRKQQEAAKQTEADAKVTSDKTAENKNNQTTEDTASATSEDTISKTSEETTKKSAEKSTGKHTKIFKFFTCADDQNGSPKFKIIPTVTSKNTEESLKKAINSCTAWSEKDINLYAYENHECSSIIADKTIAKAKCLSAVIPQYNIAPTEQKTPIYSCQANNGQYQKDAEPFTYIANSARGEMEHLRACAKWTIDNGSSLALAGEQCSASYQSPTDAFTNCFSA